jgi:hypothetical protein
MDFDSRVVLWHLHVLYEHSHTLSPTLNYNVEFVHMVLDQKRERGFISML